MNVVPATKKIGHLTPSSNSVIEPLTYALNAAAGRGISHHFGRFSMTRVGADAATEQQFELATMLGAVKLLAEAPLDTLVWNGTSASWRGIERDRELVRAIAGETGLPATTATLAMFRAFERHDWTRIALAVPYTRDITERIAAEYARNGFNAIASERLDIESNIAIGNVDAQTMRGLLEAAARSKPDCIAVVCTNLAATELVAEMEERLGIPIVDSIAVTFLDACRVAGFGGPIGGWGYVLANP